MSLAILAVMVALSFELHAIVNRECPFSEGRVCNGKVTVSEWGSAISITNARSNRFKPFRKTVDDGQFCTSPYHLYIRRLVGVRHLRWVCCRVLMDSIVCSNLICLGLLGSETNQKQLWFYDVMFQSFAFCNNGFLMRSPGNMNYVSG
jgi:hypothetical protein